MNTQLHGQLEEWKKKLIDLSRRNRLLYFRPTKTTTLRFENPDLHKIYQRLVIDEKTWRFYKPEELIEQEIDTARREVRNNFQSLADKSNLSLSQIDDLDVRPDEIVTSQDDPKKLGSILRNLFRRSEFDFAERGVRILHLAVGVLEWEERDGLGTVRSPLVLIPCKLLRNGVGSIPILRAAEDDPIINPALEIKLNQEFGISLPPAPDDWEDGVLQKLFGEVSQSISSYGWKLHNELWLGLFSFYKLVMYQDLAKNVKYVLSSDIVKALAGDPSDLASASQAEVLPEDIDKTLNPRDSFTILDADSSQLSCIETVKRGTNLIIHGPPGTGKSQTIANIMAEAISEGKKVLFVSEKMAALEVVIFPEKVDTVLR